jgi:hypothetical protein
MPVRAMNSFSQAILLLGPIGLIVGPFVSIVSAEPAIKDGWFTTNDGGNLHDLEAGPAAR